MDILRNKVTKTSMRFFGAVTLVSTVTFAPALSYSSENDAQDDRVNQRILDLHSKLKITKEQEELWLQIAHIMRQDAKAIEDLTRNRHSHTQEISVLDDLIAYSSIAEAHAREMQLLIPAFSQLYSVMSKAQQLEADSLFRHEMRKHS